MWLGSAGKRVIGSWSQASHSRSGVTTGRSCLFWALSTPLLLAWRVMLGADPSSLHPLDPHLCLLPTSLLLPTPLIFSWGKIGCLSRTFWCPEPSKVQRPFHASLADGLEVSPSMKYTMWKEAGFRKTPLSPFLQNRVCCSWSGLGLCWKSQGGVMAAWSVCAGYCPLCTGWGLCPAQGTVCRGGS